MGDWFVHKINNVKEGILILKKMISKNGVEKGYIVLIKYFLLKCDMAKYNKSSGIRTFKTEGNFKEVLFELEEWEHDKREIYNMEEIDEVPCFEISIKIGILVRKEKKNNHMVVCGKEGIFVLKAAKSLFHATIMSLIGENYVKYRMYYRPPKEVVGIVDLSIEKQIMLVEKSLHKYKKYRNKKIIIRYIKNDVEEVCLDKEKDKIFVLLSKGNFWGCYLSREKITNEDQKPIFLKDTINIYDTSILVYDFEFSWKKTCGFYRSKSPGVITSILYTPKNDIKEKCFFRSITDFIDYLTILNDSSTQKTQDTKNIYCIAHNASSVEHIILMEGIAKYIDNSNYEIKSTHVTSTKIHSFTWGRLKFRDSMLYFPYSLHNFCVSMQTTLKKEIIIDWDNADWDNPNDEMLNYAMGDSISLFECIMKFNQCLNDIFSTKNLFYYEKLSLSSIGKAFLLKDNENYLKFNEMNMSKYLYTLYHGGRNECFFIGDNKKFGIFSEQNKNIANKIDINSSYPYVMSQQLPGIFIKTISSKNIKEEIFSNDKIRLITGLIKYKKTKNKDEIYFSIKNRMLQKPPLIGHKEDGKLMFVFNNKTYRYVQIWDFEYETIKKDIDFYNNEADILEFEKFDGYSKKITEMYELKNFYSENNNIPMKQTIKLILNGSYGSLGLKTDREQMYMCKGSKIDRFKNNNLSYTEYEGPSGWSVFITKEDCEVNSITQQAAYITAKARYNLWEKINEIKEKDGIPLYCDTDSIIFVGKTTNLEKIDKNKLGYWKIEGEERVWEIKGLKIYRFGKEIHCKGVKIPKSDLPISNNSKFVFRNNYKVDSWFVNRKGYIERHIVNKKINYKYTKGIRLSNGFIIPKET